MSRTFSCGMEWAEWERGNCDICAKGHIGVTRDGQQVDPTEAEWDHLLCDIEDALDQESWGDAIDKVYQERLGFNGQYAPEKCREFEARSKRG